MKKYFEFVKSGKACELSYHRTIRKTFLLFDEIQGFQLFGESEDQSGSSNYKAQKSILALWVQVRSGEFQIENIEMSEYERFEQAFKNWLDEKDQPARRISQLGFVSCSKGEG